MSVHPSECSSIHSYIRLYDHPCLTQSKIRWKLAFTNGKKWKFTNQAWAIHTFSQQYQYQCNSAKYWYNTNTIQYNAISFSIDYNSSQYKNVYRMMQGYVWIVIAIMKKMYMIYKMHKETFCFVRLLGNSLILIHTIYWRNCFGRKNHGGGGRIVVCGLRNCSLCTQWLWPKNPWWKW